MPDDAASPDVPNQEEFSEGDPTVLTRTRALRAEEFPAGLTPRELALALQGDLLDHFQLEQFIGCGGMGVVFKALDTTLDRIVAVKVVASQSISDEDLQRRFLIEAQSTARLDHPNIARIHFVGRDRGLPYIVFEYIEGENLRDLVLHNGPLPLGDALSYTYQVAHALAHAWQRDVVHRDIKPSNILINRHGQAKLVDMGLARLYQSEPPEDELTNTGVTLGTFDYISPEQARDPRSADTRSDLYSLGCTLFYMLAGKPPFGRGTAVQKLLQHQEERPPLLSDFRIDLPDSVQALVERLLAKDVNQRPQNPAELVLEIGSILQEIGQPLPQMLAPLPVAERTQRLRTWRHVVPWALPIVVLLAWGSWSSFSQMGDTDEYEFPKLGTAVSTDAGPIESPGPSSQATTEATAEGMPTPTGTPIDVSAILSDTEQQPLEESGLFAPLIDAVSDPNELPSTATDGLQVPIPLRTSAPQAP